MPMPTARRDAASPAVRKQVARIMETHNEGESKEALVHSAALVRRNKRSALVLNLAGLLHQLTYTSYKRLFGKDAFWSYAEISSEKAKHMASALIAFAAAARLAPDCIDTAVSHSEMLVEAERFADAHAELVRAIQIPNPVDPVEHNVGYTYTRESSLGERIRIARARAHESMERFVALIRDQIVPRESVRVLDGIKRGGDDAAAAHAAAKDLATAYPFSARAQLLRAHADLERVRGFDAAIDKRRFLHRTLDMVDDAAKTFHRSLVIALFRAKLFFVLDQFDNAGYECIRALGVEIPDDPKEQDLPPGSVSAAEYDDRVALVRRQLYLLIRKIVSTAEVYSRRLTSEVVDSLLTVNVKALIEHCNTADKSSAKTISDALRFFKGGNSWSFWICPLSSRCDGRKFADTSSFWSHICNKHPEGAWEKLQSVLGPKLSANTSEGDSSMEWLTFSQDSDQHDIFRLRNMHDLFDSLFRRATGRIEPDLVQMRTEKCREGAEILEGIKRRLETLPADISSSQGELKKCMAGDPNIVGHLSAKKIDLIFYDAPSSNISVGHDSSPSNAKKVGTIREHNMKRSLSNKTLKAEENHQKSEVCVQNGISGAKVNRKLPDPPMDVEGREIAIAEIPANMEQNLGLEGGITPATSFPHTVTYGQSAEEMASTTSYQNVDVLNKENTDKSLFTFHSIIQSLWNLRCFRDGILRATPAWTLNNDGSDCSTDLIYRGFSAWEKNDHDSAAFSLAVHCKIAKDDMFQKCYFIFHVYFSDLTRVNPANKFELQSRKNFASEVVETILQGLHISGTSLHFEFNNDIEGRVIKSFVDLPVLYDEQLCFEDNCVHCGGLKSVDVSPLDTSHFFTIGLDWSGGSENQVHLSEVLVDIAHPLDIKLLCKGLHSSSNYSLASMVSYANGRYICFARDQDKWLICDAQTVEKLALIPFTSPRLQLSIYPPPPSRLHFREHLAASVSLLAAAFSRTPRSRPVRAMGRGSRATQRKEASAAELRRIDEARALRHEAVAALRMDHEGLHDEAIAIADELAARNPDSAVAAHLAAQLHHDATSRVAALLDRTTKLDDDHRPVTTANHLDIARGHYVRAARLASNCVEIANRLATVRFACRGDDDDAADLEIRRAITIPFPTDPAENNVAYDLASTTTTTSAKERIANAKARAIERHHQILAFVINKTLPRAVRDVLDLAADRDGAARAIKPAKALAVRYGYFARAHFAHAHVSIQFARGLAAAIDKRPFLNRVLGELNRAASQFATSLVLAMLRAKLLFLLDEYVAVEGECNRALFMDGAADPGDEDVPPGSVTGENSEDRENSVRVELGFLLQKIVIEAKDYCCSLPVEKQGRFLFVGFNSMRQHYVENYEAKHEAAKTISDALSFVKKNRSWRFWICPYCVGKKIPDTDSLLQHMSNKHPEGFVWTTLQLVLDPKSISDTCQIDYDYANFLDDVTVSEDSEEDYIFHFKRMDHLFTFLFRRASGKVDYKTLSEIREIKCREGVEILEKLKLKLKNVPTDISTTEFNAARAEIQELWDNFLVISVLDYRVVIAPLAITFVSDQLLDCMSIDKKAASKSIDAADIDALFPKVDVALDIDAIFPNSLWYLRFFTVEFLREQSVWKIFYALAKSEHDSG
uniref:DUF629 domain-containing protein n=1 Tax=Leersia perrieri TaxID=77586 RepID=A0A0D9XTU7_9ORYZ